MNKRACIKLPVTEQDVFSLIDKATIYPVPNKWGKQGWTLIEMTKVKKALLIDAVTTAYCEVAPGKLSELVKQKKPPDDK
jgi:hypothetical protein